MVIRILGNSACLSTHELSDGRPEATGPKPRPALENHGPGRVERLE